MELAADDIGLSEVSPVTTTAEIVVLHTNRDNRHMLAERIASARSLNCPKSRAPVRKGPVSTLKPKPKAAGTKRREGLKPQRTVAAPRVLMPTRRTAQIIPIGRPAPLAASGLTAERSAA